MIDASARPARSLKHPISRRLPKRRDDSGLTTLEWLLIVAAVAGLAALAVVLVTRVVSDTGEQIAGQTARVTAAKLAGAAITNEARNDAPTAATLDAAVFTAQQVDYIDQCTRLPLVYSDIEGVDTSWEYAVPATFTSVTWAEAFDDPETEGCVVSTP